MWKKEEDQTGQPTTESAPRVATPTPRSTPRSAGRATIGPSISIRGDVTGSEDLFIEGQIDGSVNLEDHAVGVGGEGRVNADIVGRVITVEGRVEGDLTAQEQIVLRGTARVKGDIKAPRVVLEDGATFRGLVDMGSSPEKQSAESTSTTSKSGKGNGVSAAADAGSSSSSKSEAQKPGPSSTSGGGTSSTSSGGGSASSGTTSKDKGKDDAKATDRARA